MRFRIRFSNKYRKSHSCCDGENRWGAHHTLPSQIGRPQHTQPGGGALRDHALPSQIGGLNTHNLVEGPSETTPSHHRQGVLNTHNLVEGPQRPHPPIIDRGPQHTQPGGGALRDLGLCYRTLDSKLSLMVRQPSFHNALFHETHITTIILGYLT